MHGGLPSGFWGLDVALGVRVNQYKSVCVILSFPNLRYIYFKLFLLTADKNNRFNRKNNRLIFWKSTKTALCFTVLSFFLCDSSLTFIIPSKFAKIFHKQFTPLLFKAIYSNTRFQSNPKESHIKAAKRILKYLKGTSIVGLWYPYHSPIHLVGYSYSDFERCKLDRKSTSVTCHLLGSSLISWHSKKQACVTLSITEA